MTLEADYAVRIIYALAVGKRRIDAGTLAQMSGVTVRFALKILRKLVAAGLVISYKGAAGGYELARKPREISLREIVETIEGPIHMARCVKGDYQCTREKEGPCIFQCVFEELSQNLRRQLDCYTMDQFIEEKKKVR
ncbi:MAG: Rrf2 family transcriptional regulator [Oscillospiraceae bacterium]|nr:Rrf2 family transcriptional regulator [Oscillospiraceae bacterium]